MILSCSLHCDLDVYENAPEGLLNIEGDKYDDREAILLNSEHTSKQDWNDENM